MCCEYCQFLFFVFCLTSSHVLNVIGKDGCKAGRCNKTSTPKNSVLLIFDEKLSLALDLSIHMTLSVGSINIVVTPIDKSFQT